MSQGTLLAGGQTVLVRTGAQATGSCSLVLMHEYVVCHQNVYSSRGFVFPPLRHLGSYRTTRCQRQRFACRRHGLSLCDVPCTGFSWNPDLRKTGCCDVPCPQAPGGWHTYGVLCGSMEAVQLPAGTPRLLSTWENGDGGKHPSWQQDPRGHRSPIQWRQSLTTCTST
jgi:hypothetical protein